MKLFIFVLIFFHSTRWNASARDFGNPILSPKLGFNSIIKVNNVYYMVTGEYYGNNAIPIYSSTNLKDWEFKNYAFTADNSPIWKGSWPIEDPEIHRVGDNFNIYYSALDSTTGSYSIGVATALTPTGPYIEVSPLPLLHLTESTYYPNLALDGSSLYLFYRLDYGPTNFTAVSLTANGTAIASSTHTNLVISNPFGASVASSWHFQRGSMDYLIFAADSGIYGYKLQVAASISGPLGPYEALVDPLIASGSYWEPSIVRDLDDENDVLIFSEHNSPYRVYAASLEWQSNWPVVVDFSPTSKHRN